MGYSCRGYSKGKCFHSARSKLNVLVRQRAFALIIITLAFSQSFSSFVPKAFADGLFMEEISANVGNRDLNLVIRMTPPFITSEALQNSTLRPTIDFRLFDTLTNATVDHVTYFITIEREGEVLLADWFHDHSGELSLEIRPKDTERVVVRGEQDPILQAYIGRGENNPVVAEGPIFLEGGLYDFYVRILTIDYDRAFLPDDLQPVFDAGLSIGTESEHNITIGNKSSIPIRLISYYDNIQSFDFDEEQNLIQFEMPFDWNTSRIEDVNIMVHEEVVLPKPSVLSNTTMYSGTVNGIDVTQNIVLDNTSPDRNIVHFMLPKPVLLQLSERLVADIGEEREEQQLPQVMNFTLKPEGISEAKETAVADDENEIIVLANQSRPANATTSESVTKLTQLSDYGVNLTWSPSAIEPDIPIRFGITFFDPETGEQLSQNVSYSFMVMAAHRPEIHYVHRTDKVAINGSAEQVVTFEDDATGPVIVTVANIDNTGEQAEFPVVIVPEFDVSMIGPLTLLVIPLAATIVILRTRLQNSLFRS